MILDALSTDLVCEQRLDLVMSRNHKVEGHVGLITACKRRVYRHAAIRLIALRSALQVVVTLTIVSWLVLRWKWVWSEWQCRLLSTVYS